MSAVDNQAVGDNLIMEQDLIPNTRFAIVSPSMCDEFPDHYTLCEVGDIKDFNSCVSAFITRELESELKTCDKGKDIVVLVPYKLRVYGFSDEEPFNINTSRVIFSTSEKEDIMSLKCQWNFAESSDGNTFSIKSSGDKMVTICFM